MKLRIVEKIEGEDQLNKIATTVKHLLVNDQTENLDYLGWVIQNGGAKKGQHIDIFV